MIRKIFAYLILFILIFSNSKNLLVFAQESPPSEEIPQKITNTEDVIPTQPFLIQEEMTPTEVPPQESIDVAPTETPLLLEEQPEEVLHEEGTNLEIENKALIENNILDEAISGENVIASDSAIDNNLENNENLLNEEEETKKDDPLNKITDQTATSSSQIKTGDANSSTVVENNVNSLSLNSDFIYQTVNLYFDQKEDIVLEETYDLIEKEIKENKNYDQEINLYVSNKNIAYLSNDISSLANTGGNQIKGKGEINTGNSCSSVSLLNKVNFLLIDSKVHVVTINIFGRIEGNIILPTYENLSPCTDCSINSNVANTANLENNLSSKAISGQNEIDSNGKAEIETADSTSSVNLKNIVNTNFFNSYYFSLKINNYGTWHGDFLGWNDLEFQKGGQSLDLLSEGFLDSPPCIDCSKISSVNIGNEAYVHNNVSSFANTGGNAIEGNGEIETGKAQSSVSVFNFINSNIINSFGFFGYINIFGELDGDIGDEDHLSPTPTPTPKDDPNDNQDDEDKNNSGSSGEESKEQDGILEVTQTNNVGEYVLPGDTVTFFIKVKNIGAGKIRNAKLKLNLIKDGIDLGGELYNLGDISVAKAYKITTGLVLSDEIEGGRYIARAYAFGQTGEESKDISAFADSEFIVNAGGNSIFFSEVAKASSNSTKKVLGEKEPFNPIRGKENDYRIFIILILIFILYLLSKILKKVHENKLRQRLPKFD